MKCWALEGGAGRPLTQQTEACEYPLCSSLCPQVPWGRHLPGLVGGHWHSGGGEAWLETGMGTPGPPQPPANTTHRLPQLLGSLSSPPAWSEAVGVLH